MANVRDPHAPSTPAPLADPPHRRRSLLPDLLFPLPALVVGILVMRASGVPATAWGQMVTCPDLSPESIDALRAFRDLYTDKGPEFVP